jgi:aminoglycoside phosphotransferase (APT) family kinase protein
MTGDAADIVRFLLERGYLEPAEITHGTIVVRDASRRNRNVSVVRADRPSYFVKYGLPGVRRLTLQREAAVYQVLDRASEPGGPARAESARFAACFVAYHPDDALLIVELLTPSSSLADRFYGDPRYRLAPPLASRLGSALGALHRAFGEQAHQLATPGAVGSTTPAILWLHRPDADAYDLLSSAARELVAAIQAAPALCEHIERLRDELGQTTLVHGDVRWDNCRVLTPTRQDAAAIRFVDWEFAGLGDPAWDVGSGFAELLSYWLSSAPASNQVSPPDLVALARCPLRTVQQAIGRFWTAYARAAGLDGVDGTRFQVRAVRCAAARLIQLIYERAQHSTRLRLHDVYGLQLAANVLDRPTEAAVQLLGVA